MKTLMAFVFALVLVLSLAGCAKLQKETVMFHEQTFDKADLSQDTLEWLEWYNGLPEEEQLAIDYIPADLQK